MDQQQVKSTAIEEEQRPYIRVIKVALPRGNPWKPTTCTELIKALFTLDEIRLQISSEPGKITWMIEIPYHQVDQVERLIYTSYPGAELETYGKTTNQAGYYLYNNEAGAPYIAVVTPPEDNKHTDTLKTMMGVMVGLRADEHLVYELVLRNPTQNYNQLGEKMLKTSAFDWKDRLTMRDIAETTLASAAGAGEVEKYIPEIQTRAQSKLDTRLKEVTFNLKVKAGSEERVNAIIEALAPGFEALDREHHNFFSLAGENTYPLVLSAPEVATLWHLPSDQIETIEVEWLGGKSKPPPPQIKQSTGITLGVNYYRGEMTPIRLSYPDRVTHVNVVGRTRMGKSTLIHNLAYQDIKNGKTVAVIDPHSDLVYDILTSSIPESREKDVVLFDVADTEYPVGLNLLTIPQGVHPEAVASQVLAVLRKYFGEDWSATRMEDLLYHALYSLVGYPGATIRDIPRLLLNQDYRSQVLARITEVDTLDYWRDEYDTLTPNQQREYARPVNTRIRKFYRDPTLRRIICQEKSLNFRWIMDTNKIFLASLGGIGDIEAETLGALLISKIQMAAMSRGDTRERSPVYCYIDEVQNFATTSLPKMFSEAGKYGLSLVTANQFLRQLTGPTLDAIIGNVGTSITFATGQKDAKTLGGFMDDFTAEDLYNLEKYYTVVKMQQEGLPLAAFSMATPSPPPIPDDFEAKISRIKQHSRTTYGRSAQEIDNELSQDQTGDIGQAPPVDEADTGEEDLEFWE